MALGTYSRSRMAWSTRSRVSVATRPFSLMTRETVWWETPAWVATSRIVGRFTDPPRSFR
jgi:hypothetical protein